MVSPPQSVVVGIDVSKDTLDLAVMELDTGRTRKRYQYPNTTPGHRGLMRELACFTEAHFVMEATGNYHRRLASTLINAARKVSVVNPLVIKRFAQMKLRRVKTDRADAELIARYGREQQPACMVLPSAAQERTRQISTLLEQLIKQRTALENLEHAQAQLPTVDPSCQRVVRRQRQALEQSIEELEQEREALIDAEFSKERRLLESIKGIGPKTACVLLAYVGDLRGYSNYRQLSAFIGINPVVYQSGTRETTMRISKQGHARLRTLMYLCAQSARRHNAACRALYDRLTAAGKKRKVALIAVANKLVKQAFAVVKSGVAFDNAYMQKAAISP